MTTCLVTGVAGFIGSSIASALLDAGHHVRGIDAFTDYYSPEQKRQNASALVDRGLNLISSDINEADLRTLVDGVDVVFHEAGQPGVRASWGDEFKRYTDDNVLATQRLLEAARDAQVGRFVYASSSSVYGEAESYPTSEGDLPKPVSPYGVTKLAAEHLVTLYGRSFGLPTVSLRYFTVYGPRQRPDMAFHRFLRASLTGDTIHVFGNGEQIREFTYIDDIVGANLLAAVADLDAGTVINLSGGASVSVNEVLETIRQISGSALNVSYEDKVQGDVFRTGGSTERARSLLGWSPKVRIAEGLDYELRWLETML